MMEVIDLTECVSDAKVGQTDLTQETHDPPQEFRRGVGCCDGRC